MKYQTEKVARWHAAVISKHLPIAVWVIRLPDPEFPYGITNWLPNSHNFVAGYRWGSIYEEARR